MTQISVVIGFRDWGLRRLELASTSILNSLGSFSGEVIISDYGSKEPQLNRELAEKLGLKYVYSDTADGPWSRSRALNAGFWAASGDFFVSTDADMVFSPRSFERIGELAEAEPTSAFFLQCRDLNERMDDQWVEANQDAWDEMESAGRLRERWGMGGMMAIHRTGFEAIRGFDERLHTYGGEDIDFAQRARRAGFRTHWIEDPEVRMYHMWHPPSRRAAEQTPEGKRATTFNSNVVYHDKTFARNYLEWKRTPEGLAPLVTIAICTQNRADMIGETIQSALAQTVQDFEIVIIDDGGNDSTRQVVESFGDERIRYFWQEAGGISAARNHALDISKGIFTAVLDDDDLMHPRRLEWHLEELTEGLDGNVGSFINFDDASGEMALYVSKKPTRFTAIEKGTAPGHGTWFIKTDVMRRFRYDETLTSGVDNNLMLRMLRSGVQIGHTGKPVLLRRMHDRQVTVTDSTNQTGAAVTSLSFFDWNIGNYYRKKLEDQRDAEGAYPKLDGKEKMIAEARPYLPDSLVDRALSVILPESAPINVSWDGISNETRIELSSGEKIRYVHVRAASYADLIAAATLGVGSEAEVVSEGNEAQVSRASSILRALLVLEIVPKQQAVAIVPTGTVGAQNEIGIRVSLDGDSEFWTAVADTEKNLTKLTELYPDAIVQKQ